MGFVHNYLIEPHFMPHNLNSANYEHILRNDVDELLAGVPEEIKNN